MPATALTLTYESILSTTLMNVKKSLEDNIATSTAFLFYLMRRSEGGYVSVSSLGERAQFPLMYQLGSADSYSGYDTLGTTPVEGITSAFYNWRQAAVPITISRLEERQNAGENQILPLLKAKTKQALLTIQDFYSKALLRGNGGANIRTAYTSVSNGSLFLDPLPLVVDYDPTGSRTIGSINQSTAGNEFWRNQTLNDTSTTFAGLLKNMAKAHNDCSKGAGGSPNLAVTDQNVFEVYEAALRVNHRNTSWENADIPFENFRFRGKTITWDEHVPDAQGVSATQSTTSGTWYNLNTKFLQIQYDAETNWTTTEFQKPVNQDAKVAHIQWMGALGCNNRRKQGVIGGIDTTITS